MIVKIIQAKDIIDNFNRMIEKKTKDTTNIIIYNFASKMGVVTKK